MRCEEKIGGQVKAELDQFIDLVNTVQPVSYLEIGARQGVALRYFVERVPSIKRVTVIDLPGADWGKAGSEIELRTNLAHLDVDAITHLGDSTDPAIVRAVSEFTYSVVFIDGDHTYDGVRQDADNYLPLADDFCGFHDICHPKDSRAYGATKLWLEIREPNSHEFRFEGSFKGIGVIVK